jgi:hypothetical protein
VKTALKLRGLLVGLKFTQTVALLTPADVCTTHLLVLIKELNPYFHTFFLVLFIQASAGAGEGLFGFVYTERFCCRA